MYKELWFTVLCLVLYTFGTFFLHAAMPTWQIVAGYVMVVASAITILTNKEVSIEQPRYGIAIILGLLPFVFLAVASANKFGGI